MNIEQILEKIKNSAEKPRITMAELCGEEYDNDCMLKPEDCRELYEYITKLESKGDK